MPAPTDAHYLPTPPWDSRFETVLHGALRLLSPEDNLAPDTCMSSAGLDSITTIDVLMQLEEIYGVTFPDETLTAETFATPGKLWTVLSMLRAQS